MITLLADPAALDLPELRVDGEAYQHLFRARRVAVGEEMRVVDGKGRARWGKVARVDRTSATVALGEPAPNREPAFQLTLLVPTCRPERASWLIEKATEVGVSAIQFLNMARAPRDLGMGTFDRLRRVAMAAVEQSHRSRLPEITGPYAFQDAVRLASGSRWFLDPEATEDGANGVGVDHEGTSGALLVGPEGGLDPGERRQLLESGWTPVGLGDRILRLETAAVVGAALILIPASGIKNPKSEISN
ncbi:MAG: RsmE family RNA methyltransferase [Thermoanaerobaculia bacterium]